MRFPNDREDIIVFLDVFWPGFRKIDLMRAIRVFQKRKRRIGK